MAFEIEEEVIQAPGSSGADPVLDLVDRANSMRIDVEMFGGELAQAVLAKGNRALRGYHLSRALEELQKAREAFAATERRVEELLSRATAGSG